MILFPPILHLRIRCMSLLTQLRYPKTVLPCPFSRRPIIDLFQGTAAMPGRCPSCPFTLAGPQERCEELSILPGLSKGQNPPSPSATRIGSSAQPSQRQLLGSWYTTVDPAHSVKISCCLPCKHRSRNVLATFQRLTWDQLWEPSIIHNWIFNGRGWGNHVFKREEQEYGHRKISETKANYIHDSEVVCSKHNRCRQKFISAVNPFPRRTFGFRDQMCACLAFLFYRLQEA